MAKQQTNASLVSDSGAAKSAYATPEERAAYIKQQAEKRMNERLAKLGITRKSKSTEQKPPVESKSVSNHSPVQIVKLNWSQETPMKLRYKTKT